MMRPGRIWHGTTVYPTAKFRNDDEVLVDPSTVTAKVFKPDGTTSTYVYGTNAELTKVSTGSYKLAITPSIPGRWHIRWETTGSVVVDEDNFNVMDSQFYAGAVIGYQ